jgi:CheY-like chemotaxis protein
MVEGQQDSGGERVLIVEDDAPTRLGLTELVTAWGFRAEGAVDGEDALQKFISFRPAIVITDLVMPRMGGLELLRSLQDQIGDATFIILTAQGSVESAVEAIKEGAYDYLTKPVDPPRLKILLDKVVERQETLREVKVLRRQLREHGTFGPIVGNSPGIRKVYQVRPRLPARRFSSGVSRGRAKSWSRRPSTNSARGPPCPTCRSIAPRFLRRSSKARCSVTRRARSRARTNGVRAASSWRIAARCSWTRSPR